jgi:CCR4-NOT transcription complex subunit 3
MVGGRSVFPDSTPVVDDYEVLRRLPIDTVIFLFYYREGTYTQYLASQELKRQNWRFHRKFGVWFKRVDGGVKAVNPAFEYGSYLYFDVSGENWGIKTKNDFTFEYEYLEEDSIPVDSSGSSELSIHRPLVPLQTQPVK